MNADSAISYLESLVSVTDVLKTIRAIEIIGKERRLDAVPVLQRLYFLMDVRIQDCLVTALSQIPSPQAVALVVSALGSPSFSVQMAAWGSIEVVNSHSPDLLLDLLKEMLTENNPNSRIGAVRGLAVINTSNSRAALCKRMEVEEDERVLREMASLLGLLCTPDIVQELERLANIPHLRDYALRGLGIASNILGGRACSMASQAISRIIG